VTRSACAKHSAYLDLDVKHRFRVDRQPECGLHIMCESLFIGLFNLGPPLHECRVVNVV
jgi:hypothetical protein